MWTLVIKLFFLLFVNVACTSGMGRSTTITCGNFIPISHIRLIMNTVLSTNVIRGAGSHLEFCSERQES